MKETFDDIETLFSGVLNTDISDDLKNESFENLGGDSIKALSLVAKVKELGIDMDIEELLSSQPLDKVTYNILSSSISNAYQQEQTGFIETFIVTEGDKNILTINIKQYDETICNKSINEIMHTHDILRCIKKDGRLYIEKAGDKFFALPDFNNDNSMFNVKHTVKEGKDYLTFEIDKQICDIESLKILYDDFVYYYKEYLSGKSPEKRKKTAPYSEWTSMIKKKLSNFSYRNNFPKKQIYNSKDYSKNIKYHFSVKLNNIVSKDVILSAFQNTVKGMYDYKQSYIKLYDDKRIFEEDGLNFANTIGNITYPIVSLFDGKKSKWKEYEYENEFINIPDNENSVIGLQYICSKIEEDEDFPIEKCEGKTYFGEDIFVKVFENKNNTEIKIICKENCVDEFSFAFVDEIKKLDKSKLKKVASDYGHNECTEKDFKLICNRYGIENIERIYRLLDIQKGMLYHCIENENSLEYKMQYVIEIQSYMDIEYVELALKLIAKKYPALRTAIAYTRLSEPVSVILSNREPDIKIIDVDDIKESLVTEYAQRDIEKKINLEQDSLMSATILNGGNKIAIILNIHHIIADGWCMPIIFRDFSQFYEKLLLGDEINYTESKVYEKYINRIYSFDIKKGLNFYKNLLEDYEGETTIPPIKANVNYQETQKERIHITFPQQLKEEIKNLALKCEVTENTILETIVGIVLQKYNNSNDVVFGKVVSGRNVDVSGIQSAVGLFVNTIPVRVKNEGNNFYELLQNQQKQNLDAMNYHFCSLSQIYSAIKRKVVNILYVYENYYMSDEINKDRQDIKVENHSDDTNYDITIVVTNYDELKIELVYNKGVYQKSEATRILKAIRKVTQQITNDAFIEVSNIEIVNKEDKNKMLKEFNNTTTEYARDSSLMELFDKCVEKYPEKIAIEAGENSITYKQLQEMSSGFAQQLINQGVTKGDHIAIVANKTIDTIIYIFAVIKAGAAYVPIEPQNPKTRTEYILQDCNAKMVLDGKIDIEHISAKSYHLEVKPTDIAYLMYTSGTQGKPKATMVTHRNIIRLVNNETYLPLNKDTRILQTGSIAFDASTFEIWGTLLNGGTLCLAEVSDLLSGEKLKALIKEKKINEMFMTTALFNQHISEDKTVYNDLEHLAIGGEKLSEKYAKIFLDQNNNVKLYNCYGPTENTTFTTFGLIKKDFNRITIGKPISNTKVYIMDGNNLCPIGVYGELCAGGDGVSKGYYNRENLTKKSFIKNPFDEGMLYRTKDIARFLENGEIEFFGRMDNQLKIRGFRIELEEIEKVIENYKSVEKSCVIADENKVLKAYFTANKAIDVNKLYEFLKNKLPDYMVPRYIMQISKMPTTINGKLDRRKLPKNDKPIMKQYVAPQNEQERKMLQIFSNVLMVNDIGMADDFFELGGHSLKAVMLINEIENIFGVRLTVKQIIANKTPQEIIRLINDKSNVKYTCITKAQQKPYYEMSSAQKRIYMLTQMDKNSILYNMPVILSSRKKLDKDKVQKVFLELIKRHESLRTSYFIKDGQMYQKINNLKDISFEVTVGEIDGFVKPFDLSKAPLVRVQISENEPYMLMIDLHHICADGASTGILLKEFLELYSGGELPECEFQYKDYSEWFLHKDLNRQKLYWNEQFSDEIPTLQMVTDFPRPSKKSYLGKNYIKEIDKEVVDKLKSFAFSLNATEYMILLSAVMICLSKFSYCEDVVVGSAFANRPEYELQSVVGMFVNTLALRGKPKRNKSVKQFIEEIKQICLDAYENQDYPFEKLISDLGIKRDASRNPLFDVMFVFQNNISSDLLNKFGMKYYEKDYNVSKFDLTINMEETDGKYIARFEYDISLFKEETIRCIANAFENILKNIPVNYEKTISEIKCYDEQEKNLILNVFNKPSIVDINECCMDEMFEQVALKFGNRIAIEYGEQKISYRKLNQLAEYYAVALVNMGVKKGDYVCIIDKRCPEFVIAILAVLKAGGVFVPIDKSNPKQRIRSICNDCNAKVILSTCDENKIDDIPLVIIDSKTNKMAQKKCEKTHTIHDLAYCIYTSGTTGKPKGVMIEHQGVYYLREFYRKYHNTNEKDRVLQFASFAFDASIAELCMSIFSGGTMVMVTDEIKRDINSFEKFIQEQQISIGIIPPQYLNLMKPTKMRKVMSAGSETNYDIVLRHSKYSKYVNDYGPTEASVCATNWELESNAKIPKRIPIGKPMGEKQIYIMSNGHLCGIGEVGELCICGIGLARGYLNNENQTSEKFVPNPFGEGKMYLTGDMAKWNPDGTIDFLGRIDSQVKIRGFRVELSEIEKVINSVDGVVNSAVITYSKNNGNNYLIAFFESEDKNLEIKKDIEDKLPKYMIPSFIIHIEKIPYNTSGKTDKNKLVEYYLKWSSTNRKENIEEELTNSQKYLISLWKQVLEIDNISIDDNFFEIGGNSINLFSVKNELEKKGVNVDVSDLYDKATIRKLSEIIDNQTIIEDVIPEIKVKETVKVIEGIRENTDSFNWDELNCYYKPLLIVLEAYGNYFYDIALLFLSFYNIYQIKNYFTDFSPTKREESFIKFYKDILQNKMGIYLEKYSFNNLPNQEEFENKIINNIDNNIAMVVSGDLKELYYSSNYKKQSHPHYFIIKGYDKECRLFYTIDNIHIDRGSEAVYKEFVIPFDFLYKMVVAYKENLLLFENEAYMIEYHCKEKITDDIILWAVKNIIDSFNSMKNETLPYQFIEEAFRDYVLSNKANFEKMNNKDKVNQLSYLSSLTNMKNVFFVSLINLLKCCNCEDSKIKEIKLLQEKITSLWSKAHIYMLDIMGGKDLDYELISKYFTDACSKEYELFDCVIGLKSLISREEQSINSNNIISNNNMYVKNPNKAKININNNEFSVSLSDKYRYDMWLEEFTAVRVGKEYNSDYFIQATVVVDKNSSRFHDGIAVHLSNGALIMFGVVCTEDQFYELDIYCPNMNEYILYGSEITEDIITLRVECTDNNIKFITVTNNEKNVVKTIKTTSNNTKVELFTRTWEKRNHIASFKDIKIK